MRRSSLALTVLLAGSLHLSPAYADVLEALSDDSLSVTPKDGHSLFNDSIDKATTSIDMFMFHLSDLETVKHLVAAKARGVQVRLILDRKTLSAPSAKSISDQLTQNGVTVRASTPQFSISHAKTAVFDNQWALVTTINLTRTDWYTRDFGVKTTDMNVVNDVEKVFAADWDNAQNNTNNTPELSDGKLVVSPVNSKDKLLALINSAHQSIYLEVENLGDKEILAALEDRSKNEVKVVVVVPACVEGGGTRNLPFMTELAGAGVDARLAVPPYTGTNPYIHAKTIVVDGQDFFVGSENFSYNSLLSARELGLIERSSSISSMIQSTIEVDANQATPSAQMSATFSCSTKTGAAQGSQGQTATP